MDLRRRMSHGVIEARLKQFFSFDTGHKRFDRSTEGEETQRVVFKQFYRISFTFVTCSDIFECKNLASTKTELPCGDGNRDNVHLHEPFGVVKTIWASDQKKDSAGHAHTSHGEASGSSHAFGASARHHQGPIGLFSAATAAQIEFESVY